MDDATPRGRARWISDVPNLDVIRFGIWIAAVAAITVASTAALIGEAEDRLTHNVSSEYLTRWAIISGGSLFFLALVGGLVVFGRRTRLEVAVAWPPLAGIVVGATYYITLVAMGQTEPGSAGCAGPQPCDTALGLGAGLVTVVAAIAMGAVFVVAYGAKRLAARLLFDCG
jgi:hypothetical protein